MNKEGKKNSKLILKLCGIVMLFIIIIGVVVTLTREERPRKVYNKNKSLAAQAWKDAKTYSWHEYKVSQFTGDGITLERALVPVKPELTVVPLTPCTEEQENLKDGEIVQFEHFEESLNPDEPNSLNLLCYLKIRR